MILPSAPLRWESNNNFGFKCIIDGIIADVTPMTDRKRGHVTYMASVKVLFSFTDIAVPNDQRREFDTRTQAQSWCEEWVQHFYTYCQMHKALTRYQSTLAQYTQEFYALKAKINEQEWEAYRKRFDEIIQNGPMGEPGGER